MSLSVTIRPIRDGDYQVLISGSSIGTGEDPELIDLSAHTDARKFRLWRFKSLVTAGAATGHVPTVSKTEAAVGTDVEIDGEDAALAFDQDLAGVACYLPDGRLYYDPAVENGSDNVVAAELLISEVDGGWE